MRMTTLGWRMLPEPCLYAAYGHHSPRTGCRRTGPPPVPAPPSRTGLRPFLRARADELAMPPGHNADMTVPQPRDPGASPVELLRQLQDLIGAEAVARWCAGLLAGTARPDDPALPPLGWFGGGAASLLQRGDLETSVNAYWVRVWAARGLLHGWDESAADIAVPAVKAALRDDAWRVREMAAKVVRRWQLSEAARAVAARRDDDVPRVRAAAERAVAALAAASTDSASKRRRPAAATPPRPKTAATDDRPTPRRRKRVSVDDLDTAVREAVAALRRGADRDWSKPAGPLRWDCRHTCAHIADDLIAYAAQLAARVPSGYLPFKVVPSRGTAPDGLLHLVEATGALLAAAAKAAPADARGWHTHGVADAEGFLAMGIGELVVHTHDIAAGLKLRYEPDAGVCERVVARLFPDVRPAREAPYSLLLWCTGRRDLPGREPVKRWRWSLAPAQ